MHVDAWITLLTLAAALGALALFRLPVDLVLLCALLGLSVLGIVPVDAAFSGFSEPVTIAIAALFIVAAGVRETGATEWMAVRLLGLHPRSPSRALLRLLPPVSIASGLLNNTPLVAMLVPSVRDWCVRHGVAPSKVLMPLSFASILGGLCTLLGTSTNLVIAGLAAQLPEKLSIDLWDPALVGLPVLLVGLGYLVLIARWMPERGGTARSWENPREYLVAMEVSSTGSVAGRSIEDAGLRNLNGLYLTELRRQATVLPAVDPKTPLLAGDILLFAGLVDSVVDLMKRPGLRVATDELGPLRASRGRQLLEAVVGARSWLCGRNIRDARFRTRFGAAVVAVHRQGERLSARLGDIVLLPGDTLLLDAPADFISRHRNDSNFALISPLEAPALRPEAAGIGWGILALVVLLAASGLSLALAGLIGALAVIATRLLSVERARRSIDLSVVVAVGTAFGLAHAMQHSGLATALAALIPVDATELGSTTYLALVFTLTSALTLLLSNTAAAALMFPVAMAGASALQIPTLPVALTLMVAASASFATPLGYQTNLMVMGPGSYRFADYLRIGLPLQLLTGITTLVTLHWLRI